MTSVALGIWLWLKHLREVRSRSECFHAMHRRVGRRCPLVEKTDTETKVQTLNLEGVDVS